MKFDKSLLTSYRINKGLSKTELAKRLGITRQAVTLWENGTTEPTEENLKKACEIVDAPFEIVAGTADDLNFERKINNIENKFKIESVLSAIQSEIMQMDFLDGITSNEELKLKSSDLKVKIFNLIESHKR